jgi:hypothetical protein
MSPVQKSKTLSVSIDCPTNRVYAFVSNPENLPRWATAFAQSVRRTRSGWVVETADGPMGIEFVAENEFGVLDHTVTLESGTQILNPMRAVPNSSGSEVIFTLFQPPGMSDQQFTEDAGMVERDLRTLKSVLEASFLRIHYTWTIAGHRSARGWEYDAGCSQPLVRSAAANRAISKRRRRYWHSTRFRLT